MIENRISTPAARPLFMSSSSCTELLLALLNITDDRSPSPVSSTGTPNDDCHVGSSSGGHMGGAGAEEEEDDEVCNNGEQ